MDFVAKIVFQQFLQRSDALFCSQGSTTVPEIYRFCHLSYNQPSVLKFKNGIILSHEGPHKCPCGVMTDAKKLHGLHCVNEAQVGQLAITTWMTWPGVRWGKQTFPPLKNHRVYSDPMKRDQTAWRWSRGNTANVWHGMWPSQTLWPSHIYHLHPECLVEQQRLRQTEVIEICSAGKELYLCAHSHGNFWTIEHGSISVSEQTWKAHYTGVRWFSWQCIPFQRLSMTIQCFNAVTIQSTFTMRTLTEDHI